MYCAMRYSLLIVEREREIRYERGNVLANVLGTRRSMNLPIGNADVT